MVEISKNVMVFDCEEQESLMLRVCNDINDFRLRNVRPSFSFFSWPVCPYRWGAGVFYAFGHDTSNSIIPIAITAKDESISDSITARARGYGRGWPIILEMVTKNGGGIPIDLGIESISGWTIAIRRMGGQPKAPKNGTDIGPELPLLLIGRDAPLTISKSRGETRSYSRADGNKQSGNRQADGYPVYPIAMLLGGITAVIGGIWQIAFRQPETMGPSLVGVMLEFAGLALFVVGTILLGLYFIPLPGAGAGMVFPSPLPT